jgi:4-hydroxy-L-threonine phosphate dehydrogenase PdxA
MPRIAILALNPHGGEGGEPDREEREILQPALERARREGIDAEGLFSADSFFGRRRWATFDAVVAPYHDQGLVPLKVEAVGAGVNTTLGLPIVRTSPDHGTAYNIAGRGVASEASTLAAARLAEQMLQGKGAL